MDDLIHRDGLKQTLLDLGFYPAIVKSALEKAPTIDAVEVVRCKDCNHCDPENYHCDHYMGTAAPLRRKPDDFCSYGERKGGDGNG